MRIKFSLQAAAVLHDLDKYIESLNTKGSGKRYLRRFKTHLKKFAQPNVEYKLCANETLALLLFSCITINNWVVVFRIENDTFLVYDIVWGGLLT